MAEYIKREALIKRLGVTPLFNPQYEYDELVRKGIIDLVKRQPAADVVEVRHERFEWGYRNGQYGIWCTNCGAGWVDSENAEWIAHEHDYCPKCGAKIDGKEGKR